MPQLTWANEHQRRKFQSQTHHLAALVFVDIAQQCAYRTGQKPSLASVSTKFRPLCNHGIKARKVFRSGAAMNNGRLLTAP